MDNQLSTSIIRHAARIGANPLDLATVISFETGGSFNPWQRGPRTKWGQHIGLIQMGEPQRKKYGYTPDKSIDELVKASADYLVDNGFKAGMGLHQLYATINTGSPYTGHRSDAKNGGTWGSANDKVDYQMRPHREKAQALLEGNFIPETKKEVFPKKAGEVYAPIELNPLMPLHAPQPKTLVQQIKEEQAQPQEYDHWWHEWGAATQSHTFAAKIWYKYKTSSFDPDWIPDEDKYIEALERIPEDYHPRLLEANSETSFNDTLKWIGEDIERVQRLSKGGWSGTISTLGAGLLDPVNVLASLATGSGAAWMTGGGWAAKMAYGAATGAATNFALDASSKVFLQDPHADPLLSAAVGAGFGALGGLLMRNPNTRVEAALVNKQAAAYQSTAVVDATGDVVNLRGNLSAARNPNVMDELTDNVRISDEAVPKAMYGKLRYDITGTATTSDNPFVRHVGMWLTDETVGLEGHAVVPDSINAKHTADLRLRTYEFATVYEPAKLDWLKSQNIHSLSYFERAAKIGEFNRLVNAQVHQPLSNVDPNIAKAATAIRQGLDKFAKDMKEAGLLKGNVKDNYMPLFPEHGKIAELDRLVHADVMEEAIKRAIISHSPDIADELASKIASGYWLRIRQASYGMSNPLDEALQIGDRAAFIKNITETLPAGHKVTVDDIGKLFDNLNGNLSKELAKQAGMKKNARKKDMRQLKRRTLLDYNYEAKIQMRDGTHMSFRVRDLFSQDAEANYRRYTRAMSGRLAFASSPLRHPVTGQILLKGLKSAEDLEKLKNMIRESYRQSAKPMESWEKEMDKVLYHTDYLWARINAIPVQGQEKAYAQWLRRLRSLQFIRLMANMGLNQIQESIKIVSMLGWRAAWQELPAIRTLWQDFASGKHRADTLLAEIEDMSGIGIDSLYRPFDMRLYEERLGAAQGGRTLQKVDAVMDGMQRVTTKLTFFQETMAYQQRWAAKAIIRRLSDLARLTRTSDGSFDLSKISKGDRRRFATSGLGDADLKRLFGELINHTEYDGKKLAGLNLNKWDAETVSKARLFLNREVDRLVLQNDYGSLATWMSHPIGQIFTQFRSFVFGAWTKSTLYGLHHFDGKTLSLFLGELVVAMLTYSIRQSHQLTTEEGRQKWLEEVSDPVKMVTKGWARTASASILPMIADTLLDFAPTDFRFDARSSGSSTSAVFGSPAVDQIGSAAQFTKGLGKAAINGQLPTQNTMRAGVRALVPFGNWLGLQAVLGAIISPLPEKHEN